MKNWNLQAPDAIIITHDPSLLTHVQIQAYNSKENNKPK